MAKKPGVDWTLVATVTAATGIFLGSHNDIRSGSSTLYTEGSRPVHFLCYLLFVVCHLPSG
jgi:hypothetical protein